MKPKILLFTLILSSLFSCSKQTQKPKQPAAGHNLVFNELATVWDEAMPLGNGMVGNLVWEKEGKLRFSLDRADLWDLRPMENIDFDKWKFRDVYEVLDDLGYQVREIHGHSSVRKVEVSW